MISETIKEGAMLGSLSGSALLGVIVIVLGYAVYRLYNTLHKEMQEKTGILINETKNTNILTKELISVTKASNDGLMKYIEAHCSKTNDGLEDISRDLEKIDDKLSRLTGTIRNSELSESFRKKDY